jgi:hypothetical protein
VPLTAFQAVPLILAPSHKQCTNSGSTSPEC